MGLSIDRLHSVDAIVSLYPDASPAQRERIRKDAQADLHEAEADRRVVFGAWEGDRVVGAVQLVFDDAGSDEPDRTACVHHARVHPEHQRQGIGTALMETVETEAENRGYDDLTLAVERDNEPAIRFYRERGYRWFADFKGDEGEPLMAMTKFLTSVT